MDEDQNATDASLQVVGRPTSNMLQYDNLEQEIYSCAPGENNTPHYMLMDDTFEEMAFPDMFPYGCCGYSTSGFCKSKLSLQKYFNQFLLNVDGWFANNIEYLFCAQYAMEIKQIQSDSNIALRLKKDKMLDGHTVTAGMLRDSNVVKQLVKMEQAYRFLKNIRGSPAYWQNELYEVLAMLRTLGIPTWFMTLSAADLHWMEMLESVSIHNKKNLS